MNAAVGVGGEEAGHESVDGAERERFLERGGASVQAATRERSGAGGVLRGARAAVVGVQVPEPRHSPRASTHFGRGEYQGIVVEHARQNRLGRRPSPRVRPHILSLTLSLFLT